MELWHLALEAGFRHVDTAQGYENEKEVGQGILDSGVAISALNQNLRSNVLNDPETFPW